MSTQGHKESVNTICLGYDKVLPWQPHVIDNLKISLDNSFIFLQIFFIFGGVECMGVKMCV